ncbi:hypothetical protein DU504_07790 [Haloplanus salinus]|uniref:Uncharacterized protein n=1 Tax=Haloplanus salinus TaxID=1126245 RepID=A0A368NCK5_9EURY|nr:hypothetical protein DU504_07790 [Haloplanus salinus]
MDRRWSRAGTDGNRRLRSEHLPPLRERVDHRRREPRRASVDVGGVTAGADGVPPRRIRN